MCNKSDILQLEIFQASRDHVLWPPHSKIPSPDQPRWPYFSCENVTNDWVSATKTIYLSSLFGCRDLVQEQEGGEYERRILWTMKLTIIGSNFSHYSFTIMMREENYKNQTSKPSVPINPRPFLLYFQINLCVLKQQIRSPNVKYLLFKAK